VAMKRASESHVFAIGHSTRTIDSFIRILRAHSVTLLVEIRKIPRSKHNPQFNEEALADALKQAGIDYFHDGPLGGLRHPLKDSPNTRWRNESFRGYADYMQTSEFELALSNLVEKAKSDTVAIMCAEGNPQRCHRSLVADALLAKRMRVVHISSTRPGREHQMTSFARLRNGGSYTPHSMHIWDHMPLSAVEDINAEEGAPAGSPFFSSTHRDREIATWRLGIAEW
jgi:uncharacterized protein (DUF488 family)